MDNFVFEYFRQNLERIRMSKGYSREQLSKKCGFDRTYIGKIERGEREPSLYSISVICDELDIPPVFFFKSPNEISPEKGALKS